LDELTASFRIALCETGSPRFLVLVFFLQKDARIFTLFPTSTANSRAVLSSLNSLRFLDLEMFFHSEDSMTFTTELFAQYRKNLAILGKRVLSV
jgi:hypothetical protein